MTVETRRDVIGNVIVGLSISLDGFIAGANDGQDNPLGDGGQRLFAWFGAGPESNRINEFLLPARRQQAGHRGVVPRLRRNRQRPANVRHRRRMAERASARRADFVVTHEVPTEGEWSPQVAFVTEGVERAVELAKDAAGERDVSVCAANTAQQLLRAGLLDEIELSVVPCLLGSGVRLLDRLWPEPIDLEQVLVIPSDGVTHVRYRVVHSR